jgi:phosphoribosylformylglycinamidine synthase
MAALKAKSSKLKARPKVLVFAGYGLNCEVETKFAFDKAGASADIVHINDLIEKPSLLNKYQIAAVPGGFAFGDDLGSGRAYGLKLKNHLGKELEKFLKRDTLMIGICNGFQVLTASGILPGALLQNKTNRYIDRWVDLKVVGRSPWLNGMEDFSLPVAHGEGQYYAEAQEFKKLKQDGRIALKYVKGEMCEYLDVEENPNGALEATAGVLGYGGRVLGLMPHPERGMFFTQRPDWTLQREKLDREGKKMPAEAAGIQIFKNAVKYFV